MSTDTLAAEVIPWSTEDGEQMVFALSDAPDEPAVRAALSAMGYGPEWEWDIRRGTYEVHDHECWQDVDGKWVYQPDDQSDSRAPCPGTLAVDGWLVTE